jgi:heat shock protein HspQ
MWTWAPGCLRWTLINMRAADMDRQLNIQAKFSIGQVVRHRFHPFRGVIYDVDPEFGNTEDWWLSIPEDKRPRKDQPYYHLLAENETTYYHAYVSEQNLVPDETGDPVDHPEVDDYFDELTDGQYQWDAINRH